MLKTLLLIALGVVLYGGGVFAQDTVAEDAYLSAHHYSFSVTDGFSEKAQQALIEKLSPYKVILLGEGGSHYLRFYEQVQLPLLKFLHEKLAVNAFFMEMGHSSGMVGTRFLRTGDTVFMPGWKPLKESVFWTGMYQYLLPSKGADIACFGIDFENPRNYGKAMRALIPLLPADAPLTALLQSLPQPLNCDKLVEYNKKIKREVEQDTALYRQHLKGQYDDLLLILNNPGSCKDVMKDRNNNLYRRFIEGDKRIGSPRYYGQMGVAHTAKHLRSFAAKLDKDAAFEGKVCVINTYCLECSTPEEEVSNWQLRAVEKDILRLLVKYCQSDFTLFDFTGADKRFEQFRKMGEFILVARHQH
ncbi:hypothetical protein [Chitinophaga nivalis]|uniref:Uncharacterized protein n=1 Tax=Chitinophaga nivalis TaxID=2991709 RepID=A0ABT3IHB2_9BACT|nr:hypothetical protein [Chitinophaga nivalis]MCW3466964.1 hypothetical protein [Chitinophaga nivalis]MCW3483345.1 hypothetical protein [Chitinophaga nivalis]